MHRHPEDQTTCPREGTFRRSPLAEFLSPGIPRATVRGRRGSVARPREVGWRSGEPVLRRAHFKTEEVLKILKTS